MKSLRKTLVEYLELRRGLGFKLDRIETRLGQFLSFMDERRTSRITTDLARRVRDARPAALARNNIRAAIGSAGICPIPEWD